MTISSELPRMIDASLSNRASVVQRGAMSPPGGHSERRSPRGRREFLSLGGAIALTAAAGSVSWARPAAARQPGQDDDPWLKKTLKIGMVRIGGSLTEKFDAAKAAGFAGIELNAPGFDIDTAKQASQQTGLTIDGTVGADHWNVRHSDPDPAVRAKALKTLREGLASTAAVGADTLLLVPAHGKDGSPQEVYQRAVANIRQALPDAQRHGVKILIENVWNHFLYDHQGGRDQTADALARFVDEFDSPWVGVQFDIGNHWKYGDPAEWIRTLDQRIKKLDIKGFSRRKDRFTNITEGDIDWASVRQSLRAIGFSGWVAAEVGGGGPDRLAEVAEHMEEALHCSESRTRAS